MSVEFYLAPASPFCQSVWMTLEELGAPYEKKMIKAAEGETRTEEYKAINFAQMVPAIKDGDFCMGESRSIMAYLCNKHESKSKTLYPSDPKARAMVDCRLYRDMADRDNVAKYLNLTGVFRRGEKDLCVDKLDDVKMYLAAVEGYLTKTKFVAADHLTIADFTVDVTVGLLTMTEEFESMDGYPKITEWRENMAKLPYYGKTRQEGAAQLKGFYRKQRGLEE